MPAEVIAAAGRVPARITPSRRHPDRIPVGAGLCPYCRCLANTLLAQTDAAGIVLAAECDQQRRMAEVVSAGTSVPLRLLDVPATGREAAAGTMRAAEQQRLAAFAAAVGDKTGGESAPLRPAVAAGPAAVRGIRTLLAGPHLILEHREILPLLCGHGIEVVVDLTVPGDRQLGPDPLDIFHRPNTGFYAQVAETIRNNGIQAIVVARYLWCDAWHAAVARLREATGLPLLDLELGEEADLTRTANRVQAFAEMFR